MKGKIKAMTTKIEKTYFVLDEDYQIFFDYLTQEDLGMLIKALYKYEIDGESTEFPVNIEPFYRFICRKLDRDKEEWQNAKEYFKASVLELLKRGYTDKELGELFIDAVSEYACEGGNTTLINEDDAEGIRMMMDFMKKHSIS